MTPANDRGEYRWELAADAVYDPNDDQPDPEPVTQHTWANPSPPLSDDAAYFWGINDTDRARFTRTLRGDQP